MFYMVSIFICYIVSNVIFSQNVQHVIFSYSLAFWFSPIFIYRPAPARQAPARIFEAPPAEKAKAEEEDPKKEDKAADTAPEAPMDVDA